MKRQAVILLLMLLIIGFLGCDSDDLSTIENTSTTQSEPFDSNHKKKLTLYKIKNLELHKVKDYVVSQRNLVFQQDTQKHMEIWERVKKIFPPVYLRMLDELIIIKSDNRIGSGYAVKKSTSENSWKLGISIDYANDIILSYIITHELGHVLTLNDSQVDQGVSSADCNTFSVREGCSKSDSMLHQFYQIHWADIWEEYRKEKKANRIYKVLRRYRNRFVSRYAARHPKEDIAEVFAHFVCSDYPPLEGKNGGDKIRQMYSNPELVDIRDRIRKNVKKLKPFDVNTLVRSKSSQEFHICTHH